MILKVSLNQVVVQHDGSESVATIEIIDGEIRVTVDTPTVEAVTHDAKCDFCKDELVRGEVYLVLGNQICARCHKEHVSRGSASIVKELCAWCATPLSIDGIAHFYEDDRVCKRCHERRSGTATLFEANPRFAPEAAVSSAEPPSVKEIDATIPLGTCSVCSEPIYMLDDYHVAKSEMMCVECYEESKSEKKSHDTTDASTPDEVMFLCLWCGVKKPNTNRVALIGKSGIRGLAEVCDECTEGKSDHRWTNSVLMGAVVICDSCENVIVCNLDGLSIEGFKPLCIRCNDAPVTKDEVAVHPSMWPGTPCFWCSKASPITRKLERFVHDDSIHSVDVCTKCIEQRHCESWTTPGELDRIFDCSLCAVEIVCDRDDLDPYKKYICTTCSDRLATNVAKLKEKQETAKSMNPNGDEDNPPVNPDTPSVDATNDSVEVIVINGVLRLPEDDKLGGSGAVRDFISPPE